MSGAERTQQRLSRCRWALESLKALRGYWLTPQEFAQEIGVTDVSACYRDLEEMRELGFVLHRQRSRERHNSPGILPGEYTLHPQWIGDVSPLIAPRAQGGQ